MTAPAEEHRRFEEDLAAYLLGSLGEGDRIALEAHLDQCERCRDELAWLRPAAGALAASVPQLDPPRRVRRQTLAAARAEQRTSGRTKRSPALSGAPRLAMLAGGFAAVAIAVAIAIGSLVNDGGAGSSTAPVQAADSRAAGVGGTLVVSDGTGTLEVDSMPRLPSSQVYEAWLQRDGRVEPSSTFIVDRNGAGATTIPGVDGADQVMVTREPRGGSDQPTTAPLVRVSL